MKRIFLITLTIAGTLIALYLLWLFEPTLILFGGSLAITAAIRPQVTQLEVRGIPRGIAILLLYVAMLATVGGLAALYIGYLQNHLEESLSAVLSAYQGFLSTWSAGGRMQRQIADMLAQFSTAPGGYTENGFGMIVGIAMSLTTTVIGNLIFLLAILALAYYWLAEVSRFERVLLWLLPAGARLRARQIWRTVETEVGTYIRSSSLVIMITWLMLFALFGWLELPFAETLSLAAALSHVVPRLGPVLGLIPAILIAALFSPMEAALVLALGGAIQGLVPYLIEQQRHKELLRVNPLLQVLLLLALAQIGGLWAMIFGPALAVLLQVVYGAMVSRGSTQQVQKQDLEILASQLAEVQRLAPADNLKLSNAIQRSNELLTRARVLLHQE
jgi:putative permease